MLVAEDTQVGRDGTIVHTFSDRDKKRLITRATPEEMREEIHKHEAYRRIDQYLKEAKKRLGFQGSIPGNAYVVNTGGSAIALTAATAKTVMYVLTGTTNQPAIVELSIGFDGVTATAVPALIEIVYGTAATNSTPGTGSTSFTPLHIRGWPPATSAHTAANNCTSEPTVLVANKIWLASPYGGLIVMQFPLGREPTGLITASTSGKVVGIRVTAPAAVNTRGYLEFEE